MSSDWVGGIRMIWHKHCHNALWFFALKSRVAPGSTTRVMQLPRASAPWTYNKQEVCTFSRRGGPVQKRWWPMSRRLEGPKRAQHVEPLCVATRMLSTTKAVRSCVSAMRCNTPSGRFLDLAGVILPEVLRRRPIKHADKRQCSTTSFGITQSLQHRFSSHVKCIRTLSRILELPHVFRNPIMQPMRGAAKAFAPKRRCFNPWWDLAVAKKKSPLVSVVPSLVCFFFFFSNFFQRNSQISSEKSPHKPKAASDNLVIQIHRTTA